VFVSVIVCKAVSGVACPVPH